MTRDNLMRALRKAAAFLFSLAASAALCGCRGAAEPSGISGEQAELSGEEAQMQQNNAGGAFGEPYTVRTELREYAAVDPVTGNSAYGRYTELVVEGDAPDSFRNAVAECNRRAEETVRTRVEELLTEQAPAGPEADGIRHVTYGYIASVTRADRTAFSILETEFEKESGQSSADIEYRFRGTTWDTASGKEITPADLGLDETACSGMLREALAAKYGAADLAAASFDDCAWTADALGIRFYFHADAVSAEERRAIGDYSGRAVSVSIPYDALPGEQAKALSSAPGSYIAMIDREREYRLPHGDLSVLLTEKDGETVIRIRRDSGDTDERIIEYADDLSDYYIIRAKGGFYLFRERIGYQEGFFYDFTRPDGGYGRFAYNTAQYFDSFLREISLALPHDPNCVHMAEVRRSFGESSYDASSFVPHGHYTFPHDPDARYKRFQLTDECLQIDHGGMTCRLLEEFSAAEIDPEGKEIGEITLPAGEILIFHAVEGEAPRYDDPPKRSHSRTFRYVCRLTDGRRIRFESKTESTVSSGKGFLNRFTEPVPLWEAVPGGNAEPVPEGEPFTVRIGGKDYPLIPDYSKKGHTGEEIDFGGDIWWQAEGYPGRYVSTDEDMEEMRDAYFTQEALAHPDERAELVITDDGQVTFDCFGEIFRGTLPEKRFYHTDAEIKMEAETESRTFRIILREGDPHTVPSKIEFFSEGLPATNEPSKVPPLAVYLTRVPEE